MCAIFEPGGSVLVMWIPNTRRSIVHVAEESAHFKLPCKLTEPNRLHLQPHFLEEALRALCPFVARQCAYPNVSGSCCSSHHRANQTITTVDLIFAALNPLSALSRIKTTPERELPHISSLASTTSCFILFCDFHGVV